MIDDSEANIEHAWQMQSLNDLPLTTVGRKQWIEKTNTIGIVSKSGRYGGWKLDQFISSPTEVAPPRPLPARPAGEPE